MTTMTMMMAKSHNIAAIPQLILRTTKVWPLSTAYIFTASIDTCQNKVSTDQYHMTISRAQVLIELVEVDHCTGTDF